MDRSQCVHSGIGSFRYHAPARRLETSEKRRFQRYECIEIWLKEIWIEEKEQAVRIEYEDKDILVIYKESGLPVQTGRTSRRDLVSILKNHLALAQGNAAKDHMTQEPYLGIVHRLDQPVEGLLVFAKTPKSAAALSAQAAAKSRQQGSGRRIPDSEPDCMEKIYQAAVCLDQSSYPLALEAIKKEVILTDWLGRDLSDHTAYIAAMGEKGAKCAKLSFRTLWIRDSIALLEIRLHTGRHHQIRIQMAHAGMPLLGDRKYGRDILPAPGRRQHEEEITSTERGNYTGPICLCAAHLAFTHPSTKEKMEFSVTPSWLSLISKDAKMKSET